MKTDLYSGTERLEQSHPSQVAIVGMSTLFSSCNGLDAFERSIYEGIQHFSSVPPKRWQGIDHQEEVLKEYGFDDGKAPQGGYIKEFETDDLQVKLSSHEPELIDPQELLMLNVATNALSDAGLKAGANVAVIISTATELSIHRLQNKISQPLPANVSLSATGNNMSSRITTLWHFTGPSFTLTAEENSVFKALQIAQSLLTVREVDAVLVGAVDLSAGAETILLRNQAAKINTGPNTLSYDHNVNGWIVGEGAGAVVLKLYETAKQQNDRIYALIDAISLVSNNSTPCDRAVTQACQQAFSISGIKPTDVGYLEVFGSGIPQEDESEIQGLLQAYQVQQPKLTCAIGSVKANIGHTHAASGIASLIKTALCLYYRYIPATPQWTSPKMPEVWQDSPFYVAPESKPWFLAKEATRRVAAINSMERDGTYAHLILSEEPNQTERHSKYLEQIPFYLFPLAADTQSALLEQLNVLQQTIENCSTLSAAARETFVAFQKRSQATYALAIIGRNKDELIREIQRSLKSIVNAFETRKDWQTPVGSYFTAKPLGKIGTVAFVYPGAFNSYIGLGRDLFRLFPKTYEVANSYVADIGSILREHLLYPRSINSLSRRQLEALEQQLLDDPLAMFGSAMGFATLFTAIMRDYFKIQPQAAFGYSLGEISMMCGQSVWTHYDKGSNTLNSSPLFRTQLAGPKNTVRKYWELPLAQDNDKGDFWSVYVLIAPVSQVMEALKHESRVYLTQINTPKEVVIAGDTQGCLRLIETLKCDAFRAPAVDVIHCEVMHSEYNELVKLNTLPVQNVPKTVFYSSAEYNPITLKSDSIGRNIAKGLCQQLDFPRLINRVYEDGARIFVETGVGGACSRWISETLKPKEHVTVPLNKRGVDDYASIVKALAKLISHRVSLDLSPLYCQEQENFNINQSISRTITLGEHKIDSTNWSNQGNKNFNYLYSSSLPQETSIQEYYSLTLREPKEIMYSQVQSSMLMNRENDDAQGIQNHSFELTEIVESYKDTINQETLESNLKNHHLSFQPFQKNLHNTQYQKLSETTSRMTKAHADFLQNRQETLKQICEIIQLQVACSKQWLEAEALEVVNN